MQANLLSRPVAAALLLLALLAGAAPRAMAQAEQQQRNKALALAAFEKVLAGGQFELADQYFRDDYIQHNPQVPHGRAGLVAYLTRFRTRFPQQQAQVTQVIAEGDRVTLFSTWEIANPMTQARRQLQIADLFRVQEGKLAEHWDVIQLLSPPGH